MIALSCDPYQTGSLGMYGEWAAAECSLLCSFLKPGFCALDIGANIGSITVALAKKVGPSGLVLAFEPQRPAYFCLCGNVALTHTINQTRCFNVAVSDSDQVVQVPVVNLQKPFNVGGVRIGDEHYDQACNLPKEDVPCVAIDQFDLERVDLMKIDVESMEAKVLKGASATIARCRPVVLAEALFDDGYGREDANLAAMLEFFLNQKYEARFAPTPLCSPDNLRFCPDAIFPGGDRNLVAVPSEQTKPTWWNQLEDACK